MKYITLKILFCFLMVLAIGILFFGAVGKAFNANRIMDDGVFDNSNSMSAGSIDSWLNSNFPSSCISTNNGFSSPDLTGYSPSTGFTYGSNVSAGTVIAHAAYAYGINPQVILATLQKESSVVSGDASYHCQYINTAMGYDCPDSGSCPRNPATESGFSKQIIHAAWMLRFHEQRSKGNVGWQETKPGWDNSDDPQSCYSGRMTQGAYQICPSGLSAPYDGWYTIDSTAVHMDTGATAALYDYTPHFHGNQNFVSIFESWFGSTQVPDYSWQVSSQYAFTDQTKTTTRGLKNLITGQRVYVGMTVINTGNVTWTNSGANPVDVGTARPLGRSSPFFDETWLGPNRPARMKETSVAPGQTATFEFWMKAPGIPYAGNNLLEYFALVKEGVAWMPDIGLYFDTHVDPLTYSWQLLSQYATTDQTKTVPKMLINLEPGERVYVGLTAQNTGNTTWYNNSSNPVDLGISRPQDRSSPFFDETWLGPNRPARMKETSVAPGQTATFEFWMKTPAHISGSIYEYFVPVAEGLTWMNDIGLNFYTTVVNPILSWQVTNQYAYSDANKTNPIDLGTLNPGQTVLIGFTAINNGNFTWHNSSSYPVRTGTSRPTDRLSAFCQSSWLGCNRPASMKESAVAPGQTATFEFLYKAPSASGTYKEYFNVLIESLGWMNDPGMNFNAIVN